MITEEQKGTALTPSKSDAYYIASGFFNDKQVATVDKIEASLDGLNIRYFSPRNESIPFFKETDPEIKSMMTKLIFNNNLDCMNACNKYIVNLQDEDQGTIFEYGYIVGSNYNSYPRASINSKEIKVLNDATGLEAKVNKLFSYEFNEYDIVPEEFRKQGKDYDFVMDLISKSCNLKSAVNQSRLGIFTIDDRDPVNLFLMGLFFALGLPIITYSKLKYGSNVMLVHSTYHCETEEELVSLLEHLDSEVYTWERSMEGTYLTELYLNKQTWNKTID